MSYLVDGKIISMHDSSLNKNKIYERLACSGHYQFLASGGGGKLGAYGMKPVRPNTDCRQFTQLLFPKAALSTFIPLN